MKQRTFTKDFKSSAVEKSYQDNNVKKVAEALGIRPRLLYTWRRIFNIPLHNHLREIKRLEKKLKEKEMECELLQKANTCFLRERKDIYQFISSNKELYPVEKICKVLNVSTSCYYRWTTTPPNKHDIEDEKYTVLIKEIFEKSKQRYGSPRVRAELKRRGYNISRKRVYRLMLENGLKCQPRTKFKATTDSQHSYGIAPNLVPQNFEASRLNEVWVSDITYIRTREGWLYLTTIMDLFSRQIVGWSLSTRLYTNQTVVPAFEMAINRREIVEGLIFHSDRGVQYASRIFKKVLFLNPFIAQSMSKLNCCWDNAVAESYFKTLKAELVYGEDFVTIEQAKLEIADFIEVWYNKERLHSSLGYKTPCELEVVC